MNPHDVDQLRSDERAVLLRTCFERARRHPMFHRFYAGIDEIADAPTMDKKALQQGLSQFKLEQQGTGVYLVRSGGSTSEPLIMPVDIAENHRQRAALALELSRVGMFDPQTVALNTFGYADLYRSAAIMDDLLERCSATTLPMSAQAQDTDLYATAHRFRPTHLIGTPSRLLQFARYLTDAELRIEVPSLLYAGEFLRGSALAHMREVFATRRLWSLYGAAETGIWAWCDVDARPGLFEILPGIVVEIVEPDENGYGAIVVSNGWRQRFPMFRYRLGDVGRLLSIAGVEYLQLQSRNARSFQFCELKHDIEALAPVTADVDCFQVQLSCAADGLEQIHLLLVPGPNAALSMDEIALRTRALRALLQCSERLADVSVDCCDASQLHTDTTTAKTPTIVDSRR